MSQGTVRKLAALPLSLLLIVALVPVLLLVGIGRAVGEWAECCAAIIDRGTHAFTEWIDP